MRLTASEVSSIGQEVRLLDSEAEIFLYGSRVDDNARGGDIDLLVVSGRIGFRELLRLRSAILDRIGWQQLDLIVRRRDQSNEAFATIARKEGVRL